VSGNSTPKPDAQEHGNTLRGNALRRALTGEVPNTLTPWEWEEWYKEHGVPEAFTDNSGEENTDVLFYDGHCPLCRREVAWLQRCSRPGLSFADIHAMEDGSGPPREELLRSLHLRKADGSMLRGLEANVAMWQHTAFGLPWRLLTLPGVRVIASRVYDLWARRRYRRLYACAVTTARRGAG
jgi:predicted DCC family thiol-disulfide oxidoreductase YuxK